MPACAPKADSMPTSAHRRTATFSAALPTEPLRKLQFLQFIQVPAAGDHQEHVAVSGSVHRPWHQLSQNEHVPLRRRGRGNLSRYRTAGGALDALGRRSERIPPSWVLSSLRSVHGTLRSLPAPREE